MDANHTIITWCVNCCFSFFTVVTLIIYFNMLLSPSSCAGSHQNNRIMYAQPSPMMESWWASPSLGLTMIPSLGWMELTWSYILVGAYHVERLNRHVKAHLISATTIAMVKCLCCTSINTFDVTAYWRAGAFFWTCYLASTLLIYLS